MKEKDMLAIFVRKHFLNQVASSDTRIMFMMAKGINVTLTCATKYFVTILIYHPISKMPTKCKINSTTYIGNSISTQVTK